MGLFKESDQERQERELKKQRLKMKASSMTHEQLLLAMLLEMDASSNQTLADHPFGKEAIKRCGHDPYEK